MQCVMQWEAVFGTVIHSMFGTWYYEVILDLTLARLLWYAWNYVRSVTCIMLHSTNLPHGYNCTLPVSSESHSQSAWLTLPSMHFGDSHVPSEYAPMYISKCDVKCTCTCSQASAKNISVWADWLRQSARAPSEPSETPRWRIIPRPASIPPVNLHIALPSPFRRFFSLCWSPIWNKHSGVVVNYDHTSEWVHCVHACIGIAMHKDPRNCADPRNLAKSEWDQKLGNIECVFSLYDKMKWKWDAVYLSTPGSPEYILRVAHSTSVTSVSPYTHRRSLMIYLRAVIELVWRYTWRPRSTKLRAALGGRDRASLEMHLEAEIEWTESCTWRPWSREFGDALGGRDQVNWELHLEAVIDRIWRCTGRPWSSEFGDTLGGRDRASLEMHLEAEIEWTQRCTLRLWLSEIGGVLRGGQFGGRCDGSWTVDLGMMLYLVYAVLGVNSWLWHGEIERDDLTSCS